MADPAAEERPGSDQQGLALVVGAGGGIGAACAGALADEGFTVACVDRDHDRATETADRIRAAGGQAIIIIADAAENGFGDHVVSALPSDRRVAAAVHAAAYEEHRDAVEISEDSMLLSYRVGPLAAFSLFRSLITADRCISTPAFTVISSLHREQPFRRCLGYNAAHAALGQVVATLAHEWAPRRVRVNGVAPGWIATPGEEALYSREHLEEAGRLLPFGTMGRPEQVADAVAFLSSPAADYISGSVLTVDGALSVSLARLPGEAG